MSNCIPTVPCCCERPSCCVVPTCTDTAATQPTYRLISGENDGQTIEIDLPGVEKSDIVVLVDPGKRILTVTGEHSTTPPVTYKWQGRLHEAVDLTNVQAEHREQGILHVGLVKQAGQTGEIRIHVH